MSIWSSKIVFRLSNIKILPKISAVIALISLIVGSCVWYAQEQMTHIDEGYTRFVNNEASAVAEARRLNRQMIELNYWVYRIIAETDPVHLRDANRGFEAVLPQVKALIPNLRSHAPTFAPRIDALTTRIDRYIADVSEVRRLGTSNQNEQAIGLVHTAIDPMRVLPVDIKPHRFDS